MMRAEQAGCVAKLLVDACFANRYVQSLMVEGRLTNEGIRHAPIVRIEYEQAVAIGGLGETIAATKNKSWGEGPWIAPLHVDDEFFTDRITYIYRENSLYNRRFEQRRRLKELLGSKY